MSKNDIYEEALDLIAMNPSLVDEIQGIINVPFPTTGGPMMWDTIAESSNGWRLQKNKLTGHGRILDPSNNRMAWGDTSILKRKLRELYETYGSFNSNSNNNSNIKNNNGSNKSSSSDATEKLLNLKKLLDAGAISQTEYDRMKNELMNQFF